MSSLKVAIITGGASGFGLAVTEALISKGWKVHIFDLNGLAGSAVSSRLQNTIFHKVDVTSWPSLSSAFAAVFKQEHERLDFVFANAGILEKGNFYERHDVTNGPPPEPKDLSIEINLKGVIATSYLAQHYFRANPDKGKGAVLVMTCSIVGLYKQEFTPWYAAAKSGVLNFMRSIAPVLKRNDGIRACAILPSIVKTPLMGPGMWETYPQHLFTPIETVVSAVEMLVQGRPMRDSTGKETDSEQSEGLAVEVFMDQIFFREEPEPCNSDMKEVLYSLSYEKKLEAMKTRAQEEVVEGKGDPKL
ncbi:3-beta-hydroxysteroid dehydrogenase [Diaporthe amygdali]|uniref:3-beta-hydroxysteroid dehydrogenase n=1 Tax=Phomopsis amygdali TaxID=1214568 RepID=UPI0022FE1B24|nr:3-beta-hydroxysteroid dehydrogenase [Diaporthe amygdali]KAJ0119955.1 3-beta-hydroxysteroid dehydrogenase [Diaporthe amygdali]